MTETEFEDTSIDPEQLFEGCVDDDRVGNGCIDTKRLTLTHEDDEHYENHCETDAAGRVIVGVIDADDRLLLQVNLDAGHAILPNDTVASNEDWATVGRECVKGSAGIDVTLDSVERVRRVEHVVADEETPRSITYQVVFGASVSAAGTIPDGLCEDNSFELGWYDAIPVDGDDHGAGVLDDIRLFLD